MKLTISCSLLLTIIATPLCGMYHAPHTCKIRMSKAKLPSTPQPAELPHANTLSFYEEMKFKINLGAAFIKYGKKKHLIPCDAE